MAARRCSLALALCCALLAVAGGETPVVYPGPTTNNGYTPAASYGPPAPSPQDQKQYVPTDDNTFGVESGFNGFLIPDLGNNELGAPAAGGNDNLENAISAILSASSGLLNNGGGGGGGLLGGAGGLLGGGGGLGGPLAAVSSLGSLGSLGSIFAKPFFMSLAPKIAGVLLRKIGAWFAKFAFTVLVGGGFTVAVCSFTPLCTLTFLGFPFTARSLKESVRPFVTKERLSALSLFISDAIDHYRKLQEKKYKDIPPFNKKDKNDKKDTSVKNDLVDSSELVAEARVEPGVMAREDRGLDVTGPGIASQEITRPEASRPEVTSPETSGPQITGPDVGINVHNAPRSLELEPPVPVESQHL